MKVLFSTDGSRASFAVERCLTAIGNRDNVDITVLTVGDDDGRVMPVSRESSQPAGWGAWTVAEAGRSRVQQEGFSATSIATVGAPHEMIARHAREGAFDLTLLGCGNDPDPEAMTQRAGSLVLATSESPILVSRTRPRGEIQVLLVADGSVGSQAAIKCFEEFADPQRCTTSEVGSSGSSIELVRNGHYGIVVCGVSLKGGTIAADAVIQALLREAPSYLVARA